MTEQAMEEIIFRGAQPVGHRLAPYPAEQRAALLPNVVRLMLASFLENVRGADGSPHSEGSSMIAAIYARTSTWLRRQLEGLGEEGER